MTEPDPIIERFLEAAANMSELQTQRFAIGYHEAAAGKALAGFTKTAREPLTSAELTDLTSIVSEWAQAHVETAEKLTRLLRKLESRTNRNTHPDKH